MIPVVLVSLTALQILLSAFSAQADEVRHRFITIGTGSPAGAYFAAGKAICDAVNKAAEREKLAGKKLVTSCRAGPSGGSAFNIRQVANGSFTFAIAQANDQLAAVDGTDTRRIGRVADLQKVLSLHTEVLQIVLPSNGAIKDVSDLLERRVSSGNRGSGTSLITSDLFAALGLNDHDFIKADSITMDLQATALCSGSVDAFTVVSAVPTANVSDAMNQCGARLLPLQGPLVDNFLSRSIGLMKAEIPLGIYSTPQAPTPSIGVYAGLVTRANVPDHIVREVVAAVISDLPNIRKSHQALSGLDAIDMASPDHGAPLHRAAEAYFQEQGLR